MNQEKFQRLRAEEKNLQQKFLKAGIEVQKAKMIYVQAMGKWSSVYRELIGYMKGSK